MQTSVVNYINLNFELRIDAEYYRAEVLKKAHLLDKKNNDILENLASFVVGPFGSTVTVDQYVGKSGYRYVRNKDINGFIISDDEPALIPENVYKSLPQFHIEENDLLITVVGTLGKVAIAQAKDSRSIFSCKSTLVKAKGIDSYYLLTYLNSKTGQLFVLRGIRGAIQQGLNLSDLKEIKVFIPSNEFQCSIRKMVCESLNLINKANQYHSQAEQILLSELNLQNWKPEHQLSFVKKYSDTQSASRIDAEYYQPMYEEVEKRLSKYEQKSLDSLCSLINYGTVPTSPYCEIGVPYIKGLNLVNGFIDGQLDNIENTDNLPKKFYTKENDIIISQMGTVGKAGIVTKNEENYLFASFTIRARLKNYDYIDPFVLTLYINEVAREWYLLRKIAQASVRQNTDLPTLKELKVPKFDKKIQQQIRDAILTSKKAKNTSQNLLDIAKGGVELAIEKDEIQAQIWIDSELNQLNIK